MFADSLGRFEIGSLIDVSAFLGLEIVLSYTINYLIFRDITKIRTNWLTVVAMGLLNLALQYNSVHATSFYDAFFLFVMAWQAKKTEWSPIDYLFYTLFTVVTSDVTFRMMGLYLFPLLFNLPVYMVSSNALFYIVIYLLIFPTYWVSTNLFGLDFKRWKLFATERKTAAKILYPLVASMIFYLVTMYVSVNGDASGFGWFSVDAGRRWRMVIVLLYTCYFNWSMAQMNNLSRTFLEERIAREEERHLANLTAANQKIDALYHELQAFQQSYQSVVDQLSTEGKTEQEELAKQVYYHVLRESAQEFERFRATEKSDLSHLSSLPLRSFLSARLMEARRESIPVSLDIPEPIDGFQMNVVDLALILSILFSNAIDEAKRVPNGYIHLALYYDEEMAKYHLIIGNSTVAKEVNLDDVLQEGPQDQATVLNLFTVKDILNKYTTVTLSTRSDNHLLTQDLTFE